VTAKQDAIRAVYVQVGAPEWAAANLDALTDVLRDLSWLPEGPLTLPVPDLRELDDDTRAHFLDVLWRISLDTAAGPRPVRWTMGG